MHDVCHWGSNRRLPASKASLPPVVVQVLHGGHQWGSNRRLPASEPNSQPVVVHVMHAGRQWGSNWRPPAPKPTLPPVVVQVVCTTGDRAGVRLFAFPVHPFVSNSLPWLLLVRLASFPLVSARGVTPWLCSSHTVSFVFFGFLRVHELFRVCCPRAPVHAHCMVSVCVFGYASCVVLCLRILVVLVPAVMCVHCPSCVCVCVCLGSSLTRG